MATLTINTIQCHTTEDNSAHDELYVCLNGARVWGPTDIKNNQSIDPSIKSGFDGQINVQLWDEDSWDPDDKIGEFTVHAHEAGEGNKNVALHNSGASYTIWYRVFS